MEISFRVNFFSRFCDAIACYLAITHFCFFDFVFEMIAPRSNGGSPVEEEGPFFIVVSGVQIYIAYKNVEWGLQAQHC
jgi:hypothetical protein